MCFVLAGPQGQPYEDHVCVCSLCVCACTKAMWTHIYMLCKQNRYASNTVRGFLATSTCHLSGADGAKSGWGKSLCIDSQPPTLPQLANLSTYPQFGVWEVYSVYSLIECQFSVCTCLASSPGATSGTATSGANCGADCWGDSCWSFPDMITKSSFSYLSSLLRKQGGCIVEHA